jgi:hypothetical protein
MALKKIYSMVEVVLDRSSQNPAFKRTEIAGNWWLTPVILATPEAEIRRIVIRSQPQQVVHKTLS